MVLLDVCDPFRVEVRGGCPQIEILERVLQHPKRYGGCRPLPWVQRPNPGPKD